MISQCVASMVGLYNIEWKMLLCATWQLHSELSTSVRSVDSSICVYLIMGRFTHVLFCETV